ncbi:MAG: protein-glutamate O-methyltransferase CheR [Ignavibacteriales bacterium]|nr:protein-glutamate O-methyltransferase CheR [Ignavibacteriales bacterium]
MSDKTFEDWRTFIYQQTGIYFQDNKKYLLESRLQKRLASMGIQSFEKYLDHVKFGVDRSSELKYLYEAITINETFFFRNQPQLDALASTIIPEIMRQPMRAGRNKIRIWSAASSSGEEAYSTAIMINEFIKPKFPMLEYEIVGTDINFAVVETAKKGIYKEYAIRNASPYFLKKYFKQEGDAYHLDPGIKRNVSFKILNLFNEAEMNAMLNFDIIFCANVLIYFDIKSKIKVVSSLYNSLVKNGYLFIGYSETLHGISKAFKVVSFPKTVAYKKE